MPVGFDAISFTVPVVDDRVLPAPVPDEAGFDWYEATIRLASLAAYDSLAAKLSGVDVIPAMAMRGGGIVVTRWGPGKKTLVYPRGNGVEATIQAILVFVSPTPWMVAGFVECDVRFLKAQAS